MPFVPPDFQVPGTLDGPSFILVPLGPQHNERDYDAWTSSMDHIHATPGFGSSEWPKAMTLDENLADLVRHGTDFEERTGFTYSVLEGVEVVGCVYIYPSVDPGHDAEVRSWVRASRAELDEVLWQEVSAWLAAEWPFEHARYAARVS